MSCNTCIYAKRYNKTVHCVMNNENIPNYLIFSECLDFSDKMNFKNPDNSIFQIESGNSAFLDKNGFFHNADEIPNLFNLSDDELNKLGIEITFLGDELIDFYNCDGNLSKYLKKCQTF